MLLRYEICGDAEVIEIVKMYRRNNSGYFIMDNGAGIKVSGINQTDWQRLVSDMFCDGRLNLTSIDDNRISYVSQHNHQQSQM